MPELLERLLEAHVQHELACWRGDALERTLEESVGALFRWFGEVQLHDVVTPAQVAGVVDRYVIELRVSGGITELSGEVSRLVFTSQATQRARLDGILTPEMYGEFADKILALEGVRRELLALIAQTSTVRALSARLIARGVLDVLALGFPWPNRFTPPLLSARAGAAFVPVLEHLVERALRQQRKRIARGGQEALFEVLDPEQLRSLVDELWDRISSMHLSEVFRFVQEQDIEDFVVLVYEFWLRYRKTDFFRSIATEVIDHVFQKYGQTSVAAVIDDMGVTERMVAAEALALLRPSLEHAAQSGALERGIRARLEPFYRSSAARAAFEPGDRP